MVKFTLASSLLLLVASAVSAAFVHRPTGQYDYVVVGGGAAGCVLASRLSENPRVSVLLIEAGPSNEGQLNAILPYNFNRLAPNTPFDWNFTITPQPGLNNRSLPYLRGHMLGGSTSINGMTYTRGPSSDWDRIAKYMGDDGWKWDNIQSYIRKNEAFDPPPSNIVNAFKANVHGFNGNIGTSVNEVTEWIIPPTLTAANQTGVPFNQDVNSGRPLGISWDQFTIKDGARSSAATGYINQQARTRKNLDVLVNSRVTRLIPKHGSTLTFSTVEYQDDKGTTQVTAKRDIIVSAGALNTPPLLMRSGLGNPDELEAVGITSLLDIPALGKNLHDHVGVPITWTVNNSMTDDDIDRNATFFNELFAEWNATHTGRLTQTGFSHIMFSRVPDNSSIFQNTPDPSSGRVSPHYEQLLANKWTGLVPRPDTGHFVGMTHFVVSPTSCKSGLVTLNPADTMGPPTINPRYLTTDWDMFVMRTAIRNSIRYMSAPVWAQFNTTPTFDPSVADTDESLDAFIRDNAFGGVHCVATAKMGPRNSRPGSDVVGPDFRVKGVKGLRIVDASVLPFIPAAHTMAPTYILAERAADIIKATA